MGHFRVAVWESQQKSHLGLSEYLHRHSGSDFWGSPLKSWSKTPKEDNCEVLDPSKYLHSSASLTDDCVVWSRAGAFNFHWPMLAPVQQSKATQARHQKRHSALAQSWGLVRVAFAPFESSSDQSATALFTDHLLASLWDQQYTLVFVFLGNLHNLKSLAWEDAANTKKQHTDKIQQTEKIQTKVEVQNKNMQCP